jgi:tetratricopeptide (TPR) repeat protein
MYDLALKLAPNHPVINLNRSAALLNLDRNLDAYDSAALALESKSEQIDLEKIHYRMTTAAYRLGRWESSITYYTSLTKLRPDQKSYSDGLTRARVRLREQETGLFDVKSLSEAVVAAHTRKSISIADASDYVGPIEIVEIEGKGKGVIVTKNVKRGTLLMASKAIAVTAPVPSFGTSFQFGTSTMAISGDAAFWTAAKAVQFLRKNPHRAAEVYSIWAGRSRRDDVIPDGVIDTGRIYRSCQASGFKEPCCFICAYDVRQLPGGDVPMGIWSLPSFLNHSCFGNADRFTHGNLMMVHAVTDLKKGDEVTIEYLPAADDLDRQTRFETSFGFRCTCPVCAEEEKNPLLLRRMEIYSEVQGLMKAGGPSDIPTLEHLLQEMEATYGNDRFRIPLARPWSIVANWYRKLSEKEKSLEAWKKCVRYSSSHVPLELLSRIDAFIKIMLLAFGTAKDEELIAARKDLYDALRVYAGVDADTFLKVWIPAMSVNEPTTFMRDAEALLTVSGETLKNSRGQRRQMWLNTRRQQGKP